MSGDEEVKQESQKRDVVDLTVEQSDGKGTVGNIEDMDDFDLLEATIDPNDAQSYMRVKMLERELEYEETKLIIKAGYRFAFREDDPMRIREWNQVINFI